MQALSVTGTAFRFWQAVQLAVAPSGGSAPTLVGVNPVKTTGSLSWTPTIPAGTANGDFLVVFFTVRVGTTTIGGGLTSDSWTVVADALGTSNATRLIVATKPFTTGFVPAAWSNTSANDMAGGIAAFNAASGIDAVSTPAFGDSTNTIDAAAVATSGVNRAGLALWTHTRTNATAVLPGTATSRWDLLSDNATDANKVRTMLASVPVPDVVAGAPGVGGEALTFHMNRVAGTTGLAAAGAANVWAGTTGRELVGALNVKAGNTQFKDLQGVLNQLAGTTGLGVDGAARAIP